jgi:hypothetical protein
MIRRALVLTQKRPAWCRGRVSRARCGVADVRCRVLVLGVTCAGAHVARAQHMARGTGTAPGTRHSAPGTFPGGRLLSRFRAMLLGPSTPGRNRSQPEARGNAGRGRDGRQFAVIDTRAAGSPTMQGINDDWRHKSSLVNHEFRAAGLSFIVGDRPMGGHLGAEA